MVFRSFVRSATDLAGDIAKKGIELAGNAIVKRNEEVGSYVKDVGNSIVDASSMAVNTVAQVADGTVRATVGVVKKDTLLRDEGIDNVKEAAVRTGKGIVSSTVYTAKSIGQTATGAFEKDREKTKEGLKNIGKVAAVATLAIGTFEILTSDVAEASLLETRNDHLVDAVHPETNIPYVEKTIEIDEEIKTVVVPEFAIKFQITLGEQHYLASDSTQFSMANKLLYEAIQQNPGFETQLGLTESEVENLQFGMTPAQYIWHHDAEPGVLQLVNRDDHASTGHTGGREFWGGGR